MSLSTSDLEAYFRRVNYSGPFHPSAELLNTLTFLHSTCIPFENLDTLHGQLVSLAPEALVEKLVWRRRGGNGFEQNGLLLWVLQCLGFDVRPLSARPRLQYLRDFTPPRSHVFLRVRIGGTNYLTDVGEGSATLTSALRFDLNAEQATPHDVRRLVFEEGRYFQQIRYRQQWHDVYEFTLEEMPAVDQEMANWYITTHPTSHFRSRLMVAIARPDARRFTIMDDEFGERLPDGNSRHLRLESSADLRSALKKCFGLDLTENAHAKLQESWPAGAYE